MKHANKKKKFNNKNFFIVLVLFLNIQATADSFDNNTYNNHGTVGLINMPSARFYEEGSHGITIFNSDTVQKMTLASNPYDWLEASFFT